MDFNNLALQLIKDSNSIKNSIIDNNLLGLALYKAEMCNMKHQLYISNEDLNRIINDFPMNNNINKCHLDILKKNAFNSESLSKMFREEN